MRINGKINEPFRGKRVPDHIIDEILFKKYPITCKLLFVDMFNEWYVSTITILSDRKQYKKYRESYWNSYLMQWAITVVQTHCNYHPYTLAHLASRLHRTYRRLYLK